ncbi:SDR family oxidoreductase [Labedaea rhizosphaerae]|uniref:Short-subunit dehydrogenase n=1 Tax=Labedaea rhizosphaerae TaxID=598644 RepID=A0A4R6SFE8_LABRH|nr:SDR family oxidoreductase [Labedaea rhizosphaerae]TDQ00230.1 short-subunit dehydrogenase [Labedaea rhizosphaerae]
MEFTGVKALVTGANRGLGKQFVDGLLARGAEVYAAARNPATIERRPGVTPLRLDLTDPASVEEAVEQAGDITLLINNAGVAGGTSLLTGDLTAAHADFDTNFWGTLRVTRAFAGPIEGNGGGTILNVLSVLSWVSLPGSGAYSASKAAAWSMTNALRVELAEKKISVAALHVGYMDTDMAAHIDPSGQTDPALVAGLALDGIAAGEHEIIADELSRQVQGGLSGGVAALYPQLSSVD